MIIIIMIIITVVIITVVMATAFVCARLYAKSDRCVQFNRERTGANCAPASEQRGLHVAGAGAS